MYTELSREKLLKRGFCCGLKCKNCPYDPCHIKDNTNIKKEVAIYNDHTGSSFSKLNKTSYWDLDFASKQKFCKIIIKNSI